MMTSNVVSLETKLKKEKGPLQLSEELTVFQARFLSVIYVRDLNNGRLLDEIKLLGALWKLGFIGSSRKIGPVIPYSQTQKDLLWYGRQINGLAEKQLITLNDYEITITPLGEEVAINAYPTTQLILTDVLDLWEAADPVYQVTRHFPGEQI